MTAFDPMHFERGLNFASVSLCLRMRFPTTFSRIFALLQSCSRNCPTPHFLEFELFHKRSIGFHFPFLRFFLPLSCGLLFLFSKYMFSRCSVKSLDLAKPKRHVDCSKLTLQFGRMLFLIVGSFGLRAISMVASNMKRFLSEGFPISNMFVTSKVKQTNIRQKQKLQ